MPLPAAGVRKVALLDFDVHHGNGTQACVSAVMPTTVTSSFETPFSEGVQRFSCYRPWVGLQDAQNVFFARYWVFLPQTCILKPKVTL